MMNSNVFLRTNHNLQALQISHLIWAKLSLITMPMLKSDPTLKKGVTN